MKTTSLPACFVIAMLATAQASDMYLVSGGGQPQGPQYDFYIGKYEVTCEEFCTFLNNAQTNAANERGTNMCFADSGNVFMDTNQVYALFQIASSRLLYNKDGAEGTRYTVYPDYTDHPVVGASWYGAVKYCNWLTIQNGRGANQRCYAEGSDPTNWTPKHLSYDEWTDGFQDPERLAWVTNYTGFRLPMDNDTAQANYYNEFYKAAAWNGSANVSYGFGRNTIDGQDANYLGSGDPFGAFSVATTPAGYYDGSNHGGAFQTRTNANIYGIYDLSGNVEEWTTELVGAVRNTRGGSWASASSAVESSDMSTNSPTACNTHLGFRVVSTAPSVIPSAPKNVWGSNGSYTDKVQVAWSSATNAAGYQIWRYTANISTSANQIGTTTTNTYDDKSADVESNYYYWVKSTNSLGTSGFSSYASGWRARPGPTGVSASDGIYTDKVKVSWSSVTNATGYQVWRYTTNSSTSASQIGTTATNTYDDTDAGVETNYYYWVKSTNSFGASGFSSYDTGYRGGASSVSTNRRVLLVGIDNYSPSYGPSSLTTCTNDAAGMRDTFFLGDPSNHWASTNMILYIDRQASKTTIESALHSLASASEAGDLAVYVHSSHGGTSGRSNTFICTYDASFTDAELAADLALFRTDTKVIIILDACYSAGMFKSDGAPAEWLFAERVMEHYHNIQQTRFKSLGQTAPKALGQNIAFMTACDYDESSYCSDFYSRYIGYLIGGCNVQAVDTNNNGQLSFLELHNYAATNSMAEVPTQHAQSFNASLLESTIARAFGVDPVVTTHITYNDFDGDGASDIAVFNPNTGYWRIFSFTRLMWLAYDNFTWGGPGFKALDGDYDGDGASDLTVYNPTSGEWRFASLKRATVIQPSAFFGGPGKTPVSGDYNGDTISDAALYEQPDGFWYILTTTGRQLVWGTSYTGTGFIPVSGDFDGDQINDLAMYHVSLGNWFIGSLTHGAITWGLSWGGAGLIPVSGDYDGDGYSDLAVYQPSTGAWYISSLHRMAVIASGILFGGSDCIPVPGDYDGDRYDDLAVYQPSTGAWYIGSLRLMAMIASGELGGPDYITVLPTW